MWLAKANRQELAEILGSHRFLGPRETIITGATALAERYTNLSDKDVLLAWPEDLSPEVAGPKLLVASPVGIKDVCAWATTYFPDRSPLSSLLRLCDSDVFCSVIGKEQRPSLGKVEGACVGAILGEALTLSEGRVEAQRLTARACSSTFSFVAARNLALGTEVTGPGRLSKRWLQLNELLGQPGRLAVQKHLEEVWDVIYLVANEAKSMSVERPVADAFEDLITGGLISPRHWNRLVHGHQGLPDLSDRIKEEPREARLGLVEIARDMLLKSSRLTEAEKSFLCGYLMSLIAPGELLFYNLLPKSQSAAPTAVIWYAICSGLSGSEMIERFGSGLGWRVLRDLLLEETLLSTPRGDIGIDELMIYKTRAGIRDRFQAHGTKSLLVEIFPRVYTAASIYAPDLEQRTLFGLESSTSRADTTRSRMVKDLDSAIDRARRVFDDLFPEHQNGDEAARGTKPTRKRQPRQ